MSTTPTTEQREQFAQALAQFQNAAATLSARWQFMPGDAVADYPAFMPSFDEAALAFDAMSVADDLGTYEVTLTATVRAARISDVDDDALGDALMQFPNVIAVAGGSVEVIG